MNVFKWTTQQQKVGLALAGVFGGTFIIGETWFPHETNIDIRNRPHTTWQAQQAGLVRSSEEVKRDGPKYPLPGQLKSS